MAEEIRHARAVLEHARVTRIKELEKVAYLGVYCHAGKYPGRFDVTVFDSRILEGVREGGAVTVKCDLSMRKPKDEGGRWELQLIAREVTPGDEAKAPRPRGQREDVPARDVNDDMPW